MVNRSVSQVLQSAGSAPSSKIVVSAQAISASGAGQALLGVIVRPSARSATGWVAAFSLASWAAAASVARFWSRRLPQRLAPRVRRSSHTGPWSVSVPVAVSGV